MLSCLSCLSTKKSSKRNALHREPRIRDVEQSGLGHTIQDRTQGSQGPQRDDFGDSDDELATTRAGSDLGHYAPNQSAAGNALPQSGPKVYHLSIHQTVRLALASHLYFVSDPPSRATQLGQC